MKKLTTFALFVLMIFLLQSCSFIGDDAGMSVVYTVTSALSLVLLIGYLTFIRNRDFWFVLLFSCVIVVNCGYLMLSAAESLPVALWGNRIAYLGSVFLPFSMLMIILNVCTIRYGKWLPTVLLIAGIVFWSLAASPGISTLYYRNVTLQYVGSDAVLCKNYGVLHPLYSLYLFAYFGSMIVVISYAAVKKFLTSFFHVFILWVAVFVNIGVWFLEKFVETSFEFLSVSYIITELFLLSLCLMLQHFEQLREPKKNEVHAEQASVDVEQPTVDAEQCRYFADNLPTLTPTERTIYRLYTEGKGTKEILSELNIKENTLKYHNKNIYSKLGVTSRKQLIRIAAILKSEADI